MITGDHPLTAMAIRIIQRLVKADTGLTRHIHTISLFLLRTNKKQSSVSLVL